VVEARSSGARAWSKALIVAAGCLVAACGNGLSGDSTVTYPTSEDGVMRLSSPAFGDQRAVPVVYTCDGDDTSPPLEIEGIPEGTESLVLTVVDPDAPSGTWVHWVAFDITPTSDIPAGVSELGTAGSNSWGRSTYGGPCPPSGTHRYVHSLYALDTRIGLPEGAGIQEVLDAAAGHVLDQATLVGTYSR
jgi:Raf kinase inhibitor-like YbhB/YbcL family protein